VNGNSNSNGNSKGKGNSNRTSKEVKRRASTWHNGSQATFMNVA
jgi:hypothetical protein